MKKFIRPHVSEENERLVRSISGVIYGSFDQALTELIKKKKGITKE